LFRLADQGFEIQDRSRVRLGVALRPSVLTILVGCWFALRLCRRGSRTCYPRAGRPSGSKSRA
jgi:hypothetical protein